MRCFKSAALVIVSLVVFELASPPGVYAYIDPGSGSYVVQVVLAAILGGLFAVKIYWNKIKEFVSKLFPKKSKENEEKDSS